MATLVVLSVSLLVVAPGTSAAANHAAQNETATPTPTPTPGPGNTTNSTVNESAISPGPDPGVRPGPDPPRTRPDIVVDDTGKARFHSIAPAAANASPGQTIIVNPGNYDGDVTVDINNLSIVGAGPAQITAESISIQNASGVTIQGLAVREDIALEGTTSDATLADLTIEHGLTINDPVASNVTVEDSEITGGVTLTGSGVTLRDSELTGSGLVLEGSPEDVAVEDSIITGSDRGIVVNGTPAGTLTMVDNHVVDNGIGLDVRADVNPATLTVTRNTFRNNDIGLRSAASETLDAERNAWGSPSGPTTDENPPGDGDVIRGDVDYDPWLPPVVRLTNARSDGQAVVVDLVAHSNQLAAYEATIHIDDASVDGVAVEGSAMPAEVEVDGTTVTISGSASTSVNGPVVLAKLIVFGDLGEGAIDLEFNDQSSTAATPDGEALPVAFQTADLHVKDDLDTTTPTGTATPESDNESAQSTATPTETPAPETGTPSLTEADERVDGTPERSDPPAATRPAAPSSPGPDGPSQTAYLDELRSLPEQLPAIGESVVARLVAVIRSLL